MSTGYRHRAYAESLAELGTPRALAGSGGWVLTRRVRGTAAEDAMGPYPLFACHDWRCLGADVDALAGEVVSLTLVADPFGCDDPARLRQVFPDLCRAFKEHLVIDLTAAAKLPAHHRRNVRRAEQEVLVERTAAPSAHAAEWIQLYDRLIARHRIRGAAAFSRESLARQLHVPGLTMFRGVREGVTIGMTLWFVQEEVAYYHLGAYSDAGYAVGASFAIFQHAIEHFRGRVRWLDLGAAAGASDNDGDGLARFKRGWATGTRTAWLCGRVLDRRRYDALAAERAGSGETYFPAYRAGEFA